MAEYRPLQTVLAPADWNSKAIIYIIFSDMPKGSRGKRGQKKEKSEFDQHILDLARVTRVTKGGKQMSFRACVIIGDRRGRVGFGLEKGKDVQIAVEKAVNQARKNMITVPIVNDTIPHPVLAKYKAGRVLIMPAPRGSGIIAGSATRVVLELAGVSNASAKILSKTNNKVTNVKATFEALQMFKPVMKRPSVIAPTVSAEQPAAPVEPAAELGDTEAGKRKKKEKAVSAS